MLIKSRMSFNSNMLESLRRSGFVCFPVLTVNRKNANHVVPLCKLRPSTSVLKFIVSDSAWVYVSTVPAFAGRGIEKWCAGSRRVCVYGVRSRHVCECIFVCVCGGCEHSLDRARTFYICTTLCMEYIQVVLARVRRAENTAIFEVRSTNVLCARTQERERSMCMCVYVLRYGSDKYKRM